MAPRRSKRKRVRKELPNFVYGSRKATNVKQVSPGIEHTTGSSQSPSLASQKHLDLEAFPAEVMLQILRFLPLRDLVAAGLVCKKWNKLCKHTSLWKTVSFERSVPHKLPWNFWRRLDKLGTTCLDLHTCVDPDTFPPHMAIKDIINRKKVTAVYLGVLERGELTRVVRDMPQLRILHVTCLLPNRSIFVSVPHCFLGGMLMCDVGSLSALQRLEELKLSSIHGMTIPNIAFSGGINQLGNLKNLRSLTLCNFMDANFGQNFDFLEELPNLEHLELGNFYYKEWTACLDRLTKLKHLSLTEAHCKCDEREDQCLCLADSIMACKSLTKLSLIMCMIPVCMNRVLHSLPQLTRVEIWPYMDKTFYRQAWHGRAAAVQHLAESYLNIFQGLDHLHTATLGIIDASILNRRIPTTPNDGSLLVHDMPSDDHTPPAALAAKGHKSPRKLPGCAPLQDSEAMPAAPLAAEGRKSQRSWPMCAPSDSESSPDFVLCFRAGAEVFDQVKTGLVEALPATHLTMYLVKNVEEHLGDTQVHYIARKEELFTILDIP